MQFKISGNRFFFLFDEIFFNCVNDNNTKETLNRTCHVLLGGRGCYVAFHPLDGRKQLRRLSPEQKLTASNQEQILLQNGPVGLINKVKPIGFMKPLR